MSLRYWFSPLPLTGKSRRTPENILRNALARISSSNALQKITCEEFKLAKLLAFILKSSAEKGSITIWLKSVAMLM